MSEEQQTRLAIVVATIFTAVGVAGVLGLVFQSYLFG